MVLVCIEVIGQEPWRDAVIDTVSDKQRSIITYEVPPGRLGDCIMAYCKAKWLSHKYHLELLYKPFQYSDRFLLSTTEKCFSEGALEQCHYRRRIQRWQEATQSLHNTFLTTTISTRIDTCLYRESFRGKSFDSHGRFLYADTIFEKIVMYPSFGVDLKTMLTPLAPVTKIDLPVGYISVGIHIRKGGDYDGELQSQQLLDDEPIVHKKRDTPDRVHPLKFPTTQYYIDRLVELSEILDDKPLYVYICTDDQDPEKLMRVIRERVHKANITYRCSLRNDTDKAMLDDIYSLAECDCLIRSCSHFAGVAQLLGNHTIIIRPNKYCWCDNTLEISESTIVIPDRQQHKIAQYTLSEDNYGVIRERIQRMFDMQQRECGCAAVPCIPAVKFSHGAHNGIKDLIQVD